MGSSDRASAEEAGGMDRLRNVASGYPSLNHILYVKFNVQIFSFLIFGLKSHTEHWD